MGLWYTNGSPNLGQKTRPYYNQQKKKKKKKKKICKVVDFVVPADHRIKLKECEKRDKYLDLGRELKKLWNMKVTIIPIGIGAFSTVTKGLLKGLEDLEVGGRVETIRTTALLKTARIVRRLAITQSPVKDHQLTLMWKTLMSNNNHNNNNLLIVNKKRRTGWIVDFAVLADHRVKLKESEERDWNINFARELKQQLWNMKVTVIPVIIEHPEQSPKEWYRDWKTWKSEDNLRSSSIIKVSPNTERSPGNERWLAVTQTPVKNFQLTLVWKISKE